MEATKYVHKVDAENRVRYLVKVGSVTEATVLMAEDHSLFNLFRLLQEAAEFAFEKNDIEGLDFVMSRSGPTQRSRIEPLRQKLVQKR